MPSNSIIVLILACISTVAVAEPTGTGKSTGTSTAQAAGSLDNLLPSAADLPLEDASGAATATGGQGTDTGISADAKAVQDKRWVDVDTPKSAPVAEKKAKGKVSAFTTCTDSRGVAYKSGEAGFDTCVAAKRQGGQETGDGTPADPSTVGAGVNVEFGKK